ncbi:hypothetical protein EHI8A_086340 [Entamoeba histolytica HM-1:IMSS-B]|uniref:Uncharacterized protein n=4 Tax=Entamoeba histolytica TaxID=5759 RepID=A0A175JK24_ENTHI|nr:hypothetical protein EHI8A_086340 [Entamoeba histolytica HM-1:IMSS-B]EMS12714.1 hypothetical protein KM1_081370 [Entamoeba histolytica HM-3:IMSS]ENY61875.1 unknown protein, putative [Entamoeba histolytica HM-1:IMSS-A]GAT93774.1 hypothetical protein CL6EHI_c00072 [Entamoeba histolytica]
MSRTQSRIARLSQMFEQKQNDGVPKLEELKAKRRTPSFGKSAKKDENHLTSDTISTPNNENNRVIEKPIETIPLDKFDDDLDYEEEIIFEKKK